MIIFLTYEISFKLLEKENCISKVFFAIILRMKKYLHIFILFFSMLTFTFKSYAQWEYITQSSRKTSYYLDYKTIKKQSGSVFWWQLADFSKPGVNNSMSNVVFYQGDCYKSLIKPIIFLIHKEQLGKGIGMEYKLPPKFTGWSPVQDDVRGKIMDIVCNYVK